MTNCGKSWLVSGEGLTCRWVWLLADRVWLFVLTSQFVVRAEKMSLTPSDLQQILTSIKPLSQTGVQWLSKLFWFLNKRLCIRTVLSVGEKTFIDSKNKKQFTKYLSLAYDWAYIFIWNFKVVVFFVTLLVMSSCQTVRWVRRMKDEHSKKIKHFGERMSWWSQSRYSITVNFKRRINFSNFQFEYSHERGACGIALVWPTQVHFLNVKIHISFWYLAHSSFEILFTVLTKVSVN
jgi:hypothetical protein